MGRMGVFVVAVYLASCGDTNPSSITKRLRTTPDAGTSIVTGSSGGTPGTGGANGQSGSPGATPCQSDKECTPLGLLCDRALGHCVQCLVDTDCQTGATCRGGVCETPIHCANSLDCVGAPDGRTVCDRAASNCVECVTTADCTDGAVCENQRCSATSVGTGGFPGTGGTPTTGGFGGFAGFPFGGFANTGGTAESGGAAGGFPNTGGFSFGGLGGSGGVRSTGGAPAVGGTAGTGGVLSVGGNVGSCIASQCPTCSVINGPACCTSAGKCGCELYFLPGTCQ